ncbi:myosin regulatory light polypeptide 9-like [Brevipalpus obovatus]|uniref:myosin regulatory light polypeptide 9-like n=1 Tax=Brevipalpus obovatus TaxID=246614 RepID=UPI003D9E5ACF
MSSKSRSDPAKKRATRSTSNVFAMFTQNQIAEFKEAFQFIDSNKDGIIDKNDLKATFDSLGRMYPDEQLQQMLSEAPGPLNFTMFLSIFGERIAGTDGEDTIQTAFKTFDAEGTGMVHESVLKKALMTWGEKLTDDEVETCFREAPMDRQGNIDITAFVKTICGSAEEE